MAESASPKKPKGKQEFPRPRSPHPSKKYRVDTRPVFEFETEEHGHQKKSEQKKTVPPVTRPRSPHPVKKFKIEHDPSPESELETEEHGHQKSKQQKKKEVPRKPQSPRPKKTEPKFKLEVEDYSSRKKREPETSEEVPYRPKSPHPAKKYRMFTPRIPESSPPMSPPSSSSSSSEDPRKPLSPHPAKTEPKFKMEVDDYSHQKKREPKTATEDIPYRPKSPHPAKKYRMFSRHIPESSPPMSPPSSSSSSSEVPRTPRSPHPSKVYQLKPFPFPGPSSPSSQSVSSMSPQVASPGVDEGIANVGKEGKHDGADVSSIVPKKGYIEILAEKMKRLLIRKKPSKQDVKELAPLQRDPSFSKSPEFRDDLLHVSEVDLADRLSSDPTDFTSADYSEFSTSRDSSEEAGGYVEKEVSSDLEKIEKFSESDLILSSDSESDQAEGYDDYFGDYKVSVTPGSLEIAESSSKEGEEAKPSLYKIKAVAPVEVQVACSPSGGISTHVYYEGRRTPSQPSRYSLNYPSASSNDDDDEPQRSYSAGDMRVRKMSYPRKISYSPIYSAGYRSSESDEYRSSESDESDESETDELESDQSESD